MNSKLQEFIKDRKLLLILFGLLLLVIVGLVLLIWQRGRFDEDSYRSALTEARTEFEAGNYSKAMSLYLDASEIAQTEVDPYKGIVDILGRKGYYKEATELISDVSTGITTPESATLYEILATAQQARMDYSEGFQSASRAYSEDPNPTRALLATQLAIQADQLEQVPTFVTDIPEGLNADVTQLWVFYTNDIDKDLDDVDLYSVVNNSRTFILSGYPALARSLLGKFEEGMENYWEGLYYLGRAYYDLDEYEEALNRFEKAISLGSDDNVLYLYLARTYSVLGQTSSAYEIYERSIAFSDDTEGLEILDEYISLLVDDAQFNRALDIIDDFAESNRTKLLFMRVYSAWENWEEYTVYVESFDMTTAGSSEKEEYLRSVLDYRLLVEKDLTGVDDMIAILEKEFKDPPLTAYYKGLRARVLEDDAEAKRFFEEAVDRDLEGEISDLAKRFI